MRQLLDYFPDCLKTIEEYIQILAVQQDEIDLLFEERYALLDNLFVEKANSYGLDRYEKMFGLRSNRSLSDEERRFAIKTALLDKRPATQNFLLAQMETLCGSGGYEVTINSASYTVDIKIALAQKSKCNAVLNLLEKILPANMLLNIQISYNRYSQVGEYKYEDLEEISFATLREGTI